MNNLRVIYSTFILHTSQSLSRAMFRWCVLVQPFLYTFILYMMYSGSGVENYMNNVILGSGLCTVWSAITFSSAGDIERERYMGTLENIFCCPSKFTTIIFGKVLANTMLGLFGMLLGVIFTKVFFNEVLSVARPLLFCISFIIMLFSFISVSLLIAPIFTLSRNARILMNCMEFPINIIGGFVFPVSMLPTIVQPLCYIFSPTWTVEMLRESASGEIEVNIFILKATIAIGLSIGYLVLSKFLFNKIDKETRILGTLGVS